MATGHCVFDQEWWLDALAPGSWAEVRLEDESGTAGRLPYVIRRRCGLVAVTQPPLTQTLGPWLAPSAGTYAKRLALEHRRMSELIAKLPDFDVFRQQFHPTVTNWLPFHWMGFQATVRYTYRIEDLDDSDRIWAGIRSETRRHIRRASEVLTVRSDLGLGRFQEINDRTFERQGLRRPYPSELVERLDAACAAHDAGGMLFAVDDRDRLHAAIYLVWDVDAAYLLMSGQDPTLRDGAMSLLVWEAIKHCSTVTKTFDFEGSMIQPIEQFNRSFGARQVPYLFVTKGNRKGRAADSARAMLRALGPVSVRAAGARARARRRSPHLGADSTALASIDRERG
jgi:hypothetical protein